MCSVILHVFSVGVLTATTQMVMCFLSDDNYSRIYILIDLKFRFGSTCDLPTTDCRVHSVTEWECAGSRWEKTSRMDTIKLVLVALSRGSYEAFLCRQV